MFLQPLDQGIIHAIKVGYRKRVIEHLLVKVRISDELKINLLVTIKMISRAWQDVIRDTIRNCFHHSGLCQEGAEVASTVQDNSNFTMLWGELAHVADALPENDAYENFLMVDEGIVVMASPLDLKIVADMLASGAAEVPPPEDDSPLSTLLLGDTEKGTGDH